MFIPLDKVSQVTDCGYSLVGIEDPLNINRIHGVGPNRFPEFCRENSAAILTSECNCPLFGQKVTTRIFLRRTRFRRAAVNEYDQQEKCTRGHRKREVANAVCFHWGGCTCGTSSLLGGHGRSLIDSVSYPLPIALRAYGVVNLTGAAVAPPENGTICAGVKFIFGGRRWATSIKQTRRSQPQTGLPSALMTLR